MLVEEEMRRTIEYSAWMKEQWHSRATARTGVDPVLAEGLRAYAAEQMDREQRTSNELSKQWAGLREKARIYLAGVTTDARTQVVVGDANEDDPEFDPEGDVVGDELVDEEDAGDDDLEDTDDV